MSTRIMYRLSSKVSTKAEVSGIAHPATSTENPSSFLCFLLKVGCSTFYVGRLSSIIAPLHLSRELYKSALFMQNKANSYHGFGARESSLSACNITRYVNVCPSGLTENEPKNKAKQSQFKPNFGPKLALFSPKLALFFTKFSPKERVYNCRYSVLT